MKVIYKSGIFVWVFIIFVQIFTPSFNYKSVHIQPDLILVLITFISLRFSGDFAIFFGFLNGLLQDFTTQSSLIGILALSKSLNAYSLHFIQKYSTIWKRELKIFFIFLSYIIHNFIYYYLHLGGEIPFFSIGVFTILIQSLISISIFLVFEKIFFKSELL